MRLLFLTHSFNSLTQRLYVELQEQGHEVSVEFDINDAVAIEAVELFQPDLIIAPFLKRAIPKAIWLHHICLVVHPGIKGDRGPSALDWAILNDEKTWGVTVLQANAEMDAGDIWACVEFPMRHTTKASLYRNEVTKAAVEAVLQAVERFSQGGGYPPPESLSELRGTTKGQLRPLMTQSDRLIDWSRDDTQAVLRKIHSADGFPGVRDSLYGRELFLFDARIEKTLQAKAGEIIARCGPALCRATVDGAVWIGHLRDKHSPHPFKLPATQVLSQELQDLPEISPGNATGYQEIVYEEQDGVGYLHFSFYNGAMGAAQCERLRAAYRQARQRDTRVIVLMGGPDFWSNGMNLNLIEAADSPADESWRNINAIDDLALEIMTTQTHLTIAALQGNTGAGGVFLARAADYVWTQKGVILNPHYKDMGNLFGSEYWTYLLPRYAGQENVQCIAEARLPMGSQEACSLGLADDQFGNDGKEFLEQLVVRSSLLATDPDFASRLVQKSHKRQCDEANKPLIRYRTDELERMKLNFYGFDPSYHVARYNFVYKIPKSRTPLTVAIHRRNKKTKIRRGEHRVYLTNSTDRR